MDVLTGIYNDTNFDGSEDSFAFAAVTDGSKVEVAFSDAASEDKINELTTAIGYRIKTFIATSKENNSEYTSTDLLECITYNMVVDVSIDEEPRESWDSAVEYLTSYVESFSDDVNFVPKFYDVLSENNQQNDTTTEENK